MTIGSDALLYTVLFLVPGFLLYWTLSVPYPKKTEDAQSAFMRFLALSCLNYAALSPFLYLLLLRA